MVNVELLQETMDHIRENSHLWDQRNWFDANPYGTTMCFGGHAAVLAGFPQPPHDNDQEWFHNGQHVSTFARDVLGLSGWQADYLFGGGNCLEELEDIVESFIEGNDQPSNCRCCD